MDAHACINHFKVMLQTTPFISNAYRHARDLKVNSALANNLAGDHEFLNQTRGSDTACILLAGYKPYLYPYTLPRLLRYTPKDMDVVIVTAGKCCTPLKSLAHDMGWSYLATKDNNVSLAQNKAISLVPHARYIIKLDEDIFVTDGLFDGLLEARDRALAGSYVPGPIAPILPVNGYGHLKVLERFGAYDEYARRFEIPRCEANPDAHIERNPQAAQFMWGEGGYIPLLDEMASILGTDPKRENPCAIRFSIGAILFERTIWEEMGYFDVQHGFVGLGLDERQLCSWCTINSHPIIVSENVVAGHFGFGQQTEGMKQYLTLHPEMFEMLR